MKTLLTILILLIVNVMSLFSQKELYNWFFNQGMISFNENEKQPNYTYLYKSTALEGTASISDKDGNLLFYTNGTTVWNSEHQIMDNGDKIQGSTSVAMSSLIVKKPLSQTIYYLFVINENYSGYTTADSNNYYSYYNIIDMKANDGLGKVVHKNEVIDRDIMTEIQYAVLNDDCKSATVFFHSRAKNELSAYNFDFEGFKNINKYSIDDFLALNDIHGDIKYNPKHRLIAFCESNSKKKAIAIHIYSYDKDTLEHFQTIGVHCPYSDERFFFYVGNISFSPDYEQLYSAVSYKDTLYLRQYELTNIPSNRYYKFIDEISSQHYKPITPYINLGPDSCLYMNIRQGILQIENPNDHIDSLVINHLFAEEDKSSNSFPNNLDQLLYRTPFNIETPDTVLACQGSDALLDFTSDKPNKVTWWRGPGGFESEEPFVYFDSVGIEQAGMYYLTATSEECVEDYDSLYLQVNPSPDLAFKKSFYEFCEGDSVTISPQGDFAKYEWSNGAKTKSISIKESGTYTLTVENEYGCTNSESVEVLVHPVPGLSIASDGPLAICDGGKVTLEAATDVPCDVLWSTGDTTREILVTERGTYSVTATTEFGCTETSEVSIEVGEVPEVAIEASGTICKGDTLTLTASANMDCTFYWSTGDTTQSIKVIEEDLYSVIATTNAGCEGEAEIEVIFAEAEPFTLSATRDTLCPGETSTLSPSRDYAFYEWSNGETTREITVDKAGIYTLTATDENACETDASYEIFETIVDIETVEELVFEAQHIGDKTVKSIVIVNKSLNPIKIESEMLSDKFKLLNADVFDENIEKLAIMQVQYSSDTPQQDASSIVLTVTEPCEWTQEIALRGTSYAETVFMLEDHKSSPGETLCLPIYAKMKRDYSPPLLGDIEVTFSHYHDLFKATEIRTGSILATSPTPDSRVTRFAIPQITLTPEFTVVGEICGNVYLGSATLTPLELSLADWSNELIYTEYIPGSLLVESCVEHISDIEQFEPLDATITPNPTASEASVAITGASGITHLELISPTGDILRHETLNISSDIEKVNIDLSGIASGIYYVQIRSGSAIVTKKLSVVR